ncbi:MAG TPA: hypothetical protein VGO69_00145, partial [Pyrinomonadaceae bacterium]|nr:hypothetical protein [Pyrinomonadaceae bacterium]
LLLADDAESFSRSVISLLNDGELRGRFERAAAALAAQHDWAVVTTRFEEALERATGRHQIEPDSTSAVVASVKA